MKTCRFNFLSFACGLFFASHLVAQTPVEKEAIKPSRQDTFFTEKIEPLLKTHCFACHSHGAGEMEGGLTLDSASGWKNGGDRGQAIVPGKPGESLLVKAIRYSDQSLQMPPDQQLPDDAIQLLEEWIQKGAHDPRKAKATVAERDPLNWWSLAPLSRPAVPRSKVQPANVIDAFVNAQLRKKQLRPAPRADRRTLIRRLYLVLHGLPPTPKDVAEFISDTDPRAYEKLVDRLLDSPRYGERWARHWLDTVHFADTHGCEHDVFRPNAWRYRDYVIESFNRDTDWSRFVREQLAADYFFPNQTHLTPALGFIAAGPLELSRAGTAPVTFDYLDRDDIVTQTMASFASATANCARCHNHKFDPITQEDYYSLQAVFAGAGKGEVEFDLDPATHAKRESLQQLLLATEQRTKEILLDRRFASLLADWEEEKSKQPATWQPMSLKAFRAANGSTLKQIKDGSILASGIRPEKETYTIQGSTSLASITAIRLEVLSDESLPMKGPGRCDNGNLHLNEVSISILAENGGAPEQLKIDSASADWNQVGWTIDHSLDGNPATAWGIYPKVGESHFAIFKLSSPVTLHKGSQIEVRLDQHHGGGHLIGRLKLLVTDGDPALASVLPEPVRTALEQPAAKRTETQLLDIAAHVLKQHALVEIQKLPKPAAVYGWSRSFSHAKKLAAPQAPKTVHVLKRGSIDKPGKIAQPGAIASIQHLPGRFKLKPGVGEAARRAALAEWLIHPENPLAWRSIVNRVWSFHFGRGICDTPNDFGRMGGTPSHPELLNWLAVWFRDDAGGSLKKLHRLILLSETWQQSSSQVFDSQTSPAIPDPLTVDQQNRFLWKQNRRPLDAESFRDSVLQISGRLDLAMGGPGVQQFKQSKGQQATPKLDYEAFEWSDPMAARRSIYRVVWRGIADPFMESLDFPDLGILAPKREFSVSALQALTLYNNDFVLHHSQVLADRLANDHSNPRERILMACRLIVLRSPNPEELDWMMKYTEKHGLPALCRVLLNSNEFIFID